MKKVINSVVNWFKLNYLYCKLGGVMIKHSECKITYDEYITEGGKLIESIRKIKEG